MSEYMNRSMLQNPVVLAIVVIGLIVLGSMSLSIVPETKQAVITSYGNPERIVNGYRAKDEFGQTRAGLTFRIPFVEQIQMIDKRVLGVQMDPQELLSTDQLRLKVDAYARFRITDPLLMYKTIRTEDRLREQLRPILASSLRNELGKRSFLTLLSPERGQVMDNIQASLNTQARKYGAEIVDVRIKRADLPAGSSLQAAYERMKSARYQEAVSITAEGQKEAQIIRAEAEGKAGEIYANSFGKDKDFYDFYRAMQSYRRTFETGKGDTSVILSPDNDYMRKFRDGR